MDAAPMTPWQRKTLMITRCVHEWKQRIDKYDMEILQDTVLRIIFTGLKHVSALEEFVDDIKDKEHSWLKIFIEYHYTGRPKDESRAKYVVVMKPRKKPRDEAFKLFPTLDDDNVNN